MRGGVSRLQDGVSMVELSPICERKTGAISCAGGIRVDKQKRVLRTKDRKDDSGVVRVADVNGFYQDEHPADHPPEGVQETNNVPQE